MKKLSFGNALFNVCSQDIRGNTKLVEGEKKKSECTFLPIKKHGTKSILKLIPNRSSLSDFSNKMNKRKLRWADGKNIDCKLQTASKDLCKVKEIPLEVRQKAGPDNETQIDKAGMLKSQQTFENFYLHHTPNDSYKAQNIEFSKNGAKNSFLNNICQNQQSGLMMDTSRVCSRKDVIDKIVRWMPQWLEEQKVQREEPQVEGKGWQVNAVPSVYSSFKDYCNVVYPLMLHELWSSVFRDYSEGQQASNPNIKNMKRPSFLACVTEQIPSSLRQQQLNLTSLLSYDESKLEREGCLPSKGWLVILDLTFSKSDAVTGMKKCHQKKKFGYVESFRCYRRTREQGNMYINQLEGTRMQYGVSREKLEYVMDLTIILKYLDPNLEGQLELTKMAIINSVSRIEPSLRLFQAVQDAVVSPLFQSILKPKEKNFYLGMDTEILPIIKQTIPEYANLNNEQSRVAAAAARMCTTNRGLPQLALIHGPPGTGKSTTMVALILQIFARCETEQQLPRILLTAPSNTAVDELLRKLKAVKRKITDSHSRKDNKFPRFRMVRIGEEKKIHPDVKDYRLEILRDNEVNKRLKDKGIGDTLQEEIHRRQKAINSLGQQLINVSSDPNQSRILHKRIREEEISLGMAKRNQRNNQSQLEKDRLRREATDSILASADIVATTLNR